MDYRCEAGSSQAASEPELVVTSLGDWVSEPEPDNGHFHCRVVTPRPQHHATLTSRSDKRQTR